MSSSLQVAHVSHLQSLLLQWDLGSRSVRRRILQDFIAQNYHKTGPDLESEFSEAVSLFFTRVTSWLRLTYLIGTCLTEQLQVLKIFLSACSRNKFLLEFIEVGGVLTVVEILGVKQVREADKTEALRVLTCIATSGGRHCKELICESYGVRATTECLARSRCEETLESAHRLLLALAEGNPKFHSQVHDGLIALLSCNSTKAQHIAAQTLRVVQPIVNTASPRMVEPVLSLLKSLHLGIQYEAIGLIQLLLFSDVRCALLEGLVDLLRPSNDQDDCVEKIVSPLPEFVQQAAAAKCIGFVAEMSTQLADELLPTPLIRNLMVALANTHHTDSQRQAAVTLENDPKTLYMNLSDVDIDTLQHNKLTVVNSKT